MRPVIAINALTLILTGVAPAVAVGRAMDALGMDDDADEVLGMLWRKIRNPLEQGAYNHLESRARGTGVYALGYDLASGWFPAADRRGDPQPDEYGELVGPFLKDWFFHHATPLKVVA